MLLGSFHGLNRRTPVCTKSAMFRVTTVMPWTSAVAAIRASRSERRPGTCKRAQRSATILSTGKIRPLNSGTICLFIHARSIAPYVGSQRSICKMPVSSSRIVIADMYKLFALTLSGPLRDLGSGFVEAPFAQFRHYICIEEKYQGKLASPVTIIMLGGSNSIAAIGDENWTMTDFLFRAR